VQLTNKRIFVTGHSGFKGSWMSLLLKKYDNELFGYSLPPQNTRGIFVNAEIEKIYTQNTYADIRDLVKLESAIRLSKPEVVFHFAAQPLVSKSYTSPRDTLETNVMGTSNLLDCVKKNESIKLVVIVTSDKCYLENKERKPHLETSPLGGSDIYSASKACQEIVAQSYAKSFLAEQRISLISVRAGNVIGGGDWSPQRLIPDLVRSIQNKTILEIRKPNAIRPWQHVLEPIFGYFRAAEFALSREPGFINTWNFGPSEKDEIAVSELINLCSKYSKIMTKQDQHPALFAENPELTLNSSKAAQELGWYPQWNLDKAIQETMAWYEAEFIGKKMRGISQRQVDEYLNQALAGK
jgi:CDP-glucose 4,6-dehydratase